MHFQDERDHYYISLKKLLNEAYENVAQYNDRELGIRLVCLYFII